MKSAPVRQPSSVRRGAVLPPHYLPMNPHTLVVGKALGPSAFAISADSAAKHSRFLAECIGFTPRMSVLHTPYQLWCLPRVLSQHGFGRINEAIHLSADWRVLCRPVVGSSLEGVAEARSVRTIHGLCIATFESVTQNSDGVVCMRSLDSVLLVNGTDRLRLRERLEGKLSQSQDCTGMSNCVHRRWPLRMRHSWPEHLWWNNVHTDSYARSLGLNRGLVEGPVVADCLHALAEIEQSRPTPNRCRWKYFGPLYRDLEVMATATRCNDGSVCATLSAPHSSPDGRSPSLLMEVRIT